MPHSLKMGRLRVDAYTMHTAVEHIAQRVAGHRGGYVVTPNVDHVMLAQKDDRLVRAYERAAMSLADGMPLLWASRLTKTPLPEKVSGSDLVFPLLHEANALRWRVYLLGGAPGTVELVAQRLAKEWPRIRLAGMASPMVEAGGEGPAALDAAVGAASEHPDLVLVGLGCPKQELWMAAHAHLFPNAVMVGVGASLDFLAGKVKRAPPWMQHSGLEWFYRLLQEPRRMAHRYLVRDPGFLVVMANQLASRRGAA